MLAQLSGRPLLPMAYAASRAWFFGWDKFVLPWPFSRVAIAIGAPVWIDRGVSLADSAIVQELQLRMQRELFSLFQCARAALQAAA
jgi:lysophospholipid acyltransferase (LPLAT)-like uncharacterized protein